MNRLTTTPKEKEIKYGILLLLFQQLVLPLLLAFLWGRTMTAAEFNLCYFAINLLTTVLVFRCFIWKSVKSSTWNTGRFILSVAIGYVVYYIASTIISFLILIFHPDFLNLNDDSILSMAQQQMPLIIVGTVLLVPPVEEIMFRGLIFGSLYNRRPVLAYILSSVLFSLIHLLGYIQVYTPTEFLLAFIQYLPAGFILAWTYVRADTIFAPILLHALINSIAIFIAR